MQSILEVLTSRKIKTVSFCGEFDKFTVLISLRNWNQLDFRNLQEFLNRNSMTKHRRKLNSLEFKFLDFCQNKTLEFYSWTSNPLGFGVQKIDSSIFCWKWNCLFVNFQKKFKTKQICFHRSFSQKLCCKNISKFRISLKFVTFKSQIWR